mmetsp:Transcript_30444/g.49239  ORF Transcript_30444/g.49239 Transcript_30444/m.49239 type:complete len:94 (-) Transcript_30444:310-591(-)
MSRCCPIAEMLGVAIEPTGDRRPVTSVVRPKSMCSTISATVACNCCTDSSINLNPYIFLGISDQQLLLNSPLIVFEGNKSFKHDVAQRNKGSP